MKAVLFVFFITLLISCAKNNPSTEEIQRGKLVATWLLTNVTKDDVWQSGYEQSQMIISGSSAKSLFYTFTASPAKSPWPSRGAWVFGNDATTQLIRDKGTADELPIAYSITGNTLTLNFQFSGVGYPAGKADAASGNWTFVFSK
jgi:hypothetical protein